MSQHAACPRSLSILVLAILLTATARAQSPASSDVPGRWTRIGPDGGLVTALAAAPSRPSTVYAGLGGYGSVYRSTDSGVSWTFAGAGLGQRLVIAALAVDAAQPDTVYAATESGLFKSTNGGVSWTALSLPGGGGVILTVVADPRRPGVVAAALNGEGIVASTDRGRTWKALSGPPDTVSVLAIDPVSPRTLYAGTFASGVFKSTDAGVHWKAITRGIHPSLPRVSTLAIDPRHPQTLFLAATGGAPYRSVDGGGHWTAVSAGLGQHPDAGSLAIDPGTSAVFAGTPQNGVFRSADGGSTWRPAGTGLADRAVNVLLAASSGLFAGTRTGVAASRDLARTWTIGRGLQGISISSLEIDSQNPPRIYVFDGARLFKSASRGANWTRLPLPPTPGRPTGPVAVHPGDPLLIELGHASSIAQSSDGGRTWVEHFDARCILPNRIVPDPNDAEVVYTSGGLDVDLCGLDAGTCASLKFAHGDVSCLRSNSILSRGVAVLAVDPGSSSHLFGAETWLFHSVDGGASWSILSNAIEPTGLWFDPAERNILYASHSRNGVARSSDGGVTWQVSAAGLPDESVYSLAIDPVHTSTLYASTPSAVYRSSDSGSTWTPLGTGLKEVAVRRIAIDPIDPGILYAATVGGGVMRLRM
jgi:photosystem II stability/assembly factor-like uncharacterized protein